jgi:septum formation protein
MQHPTPDHYNVILASGSPRRRELLKILGLPFIVATPKSKQESEGEANRAGIDETPLPGESPPELVQRLSRAKAQAVAARLPSITGSDSTSATDRAKVQPVIIIAADTVVVLEGKILGKPTGPIQARQMLKRLRQLRRHYVYSGLTVGVWRQNVGPGEIAQPNSKTQFLNSHLLTWLHQSKVRMRPYTDTEIEAYVASGDPLDKAGAYGIQNKTFAPVECLDGCFANVMGLPLGDLAAALGEIGLSLPEVAPLCTQYTGHPCCQQQPNL